MGRGTLTDEEYQTIKDNLHLDSRQLAALLPNRTFSSIRHYRLALRKELGLVKLNRRQSDVNDSYFKDLDSQVCYWAGLLAADGSIKVNSDKSASVKLKLADKDKILIERFRDAVKYTGKIYSSIEHLNGNKYPQSAIVVTSWQWVRDLKINFNITPRKTHTLQPPNITDLELIKAFIVGYIDGDGNIGYAGGRPLLQVLGTYNLLHWIKYYLDLWYPVSTGANIGLKTKKGSIYRYSISGNKVRQFIADVRTMDLPILERKWYSIKLDD